MAKKKPDIVPPTQEPEPQPKPSNIMALEYPIPVPDPNSNFLMKVIDGGFTRESDYELTQTVRVEYWTNDGNGGFGQPVDDYFNADPSLSGDQKARLIRQYAPFNRTSSTRGYKVDPVTFEKVDPDENGQYPEGVIDEKMMWLSVLATDVPGTTVSEKVDSLILQSMANLITNKRI